MFLLFAGNSYYPSGGWGDFRGLYPSMEMAEAAAATFQCDWWHVVELATLSEVSYGNG